MPKRYGRLANGKEKFVSFIRNKENISRKRFVAELVFFLNGSKLGLGLGLDAGTVACDFVGERVREEFISRDQIRVYLHVVFVFLW